MKRLTFLATALASLFLAGSCQQQENLEPVAQGTAVKFQVEVPGGMDTKAIADASEINVVHYEIYKVQYVEGVDDADYSVKNGKALAKGHVPVSNKTADVTFDLLVDQEYVAIFWAQQTADPATGENAYYVIDDLREISLTDPAKTTGNAESRAAFFRTYKFSTATVQDHTVTLYRPFAQLNLGTTMESLTPEQEGEETNGGYTIDLLRSQVLVKGIATSFNTISGIDDLTINNNDSVHCGEAVAESTTEYYFDFEYAAVPSNPDVLKVTDKNGIITTEYKYVAMNYFFATDNVTVEYNIETNKGTVNNTVENVPVMENFRTNIIGNLLTSKTDFEIVVDPNFNDSVTDQPNPDENLYMVFDEHQLEDAIAKATAPGTYTFYLGADMGGDVMIRQLPNVNIVIDGSKKPATKAAGENFKYDGTIKIHNGSNYNNGTLTIQNVDFETSTTYLDKNGKEFFNFIEPNDFGVENGVTRRYSNNVTVANCTFTATGDAIDIAVGVQAKSTRGLNVLNCTATNLHSLLQAQSCGGDGGDVIVENATINGKNGVAFKQVENAVVKGSTIVAKAYGIRFDGNIDNYGITLDANNVSAAQPFIVRKMTGANNTITLTNNTLTTDNTYQIVITAGSDDEAYTVPTGSYDLKNDQPYWIYPHPITINDAAVELKEAIADETQTTISLDDDIKAIGLGYEIERDLVLNFENKVLDAGSTSNSTWYALQNTGDINVTINDANFTRAGIFAGNGADVVFNSGKITHKPERTSRYIFCAKSGSTITIKDGTFTNDRARNSFFWADAATIYVEGGNFSGVASNNKVVTSNGGKVIITGGTFNFDPSAWVKVGYVVVKNGSTWNVYEANNGDKLTIDEVEYTYVNDPKDLAGAIAQSDAVVLADGEYTMPAVSKDVTIKGSENTVITVDKPNMSGSNVTFDGVTVKGSGYATGVQHVNTVTYKNATIVGEMCLYGEKNTFENCTFELSKGKYIWSYGSKESEFTGCTFNTEGKALLVYNEGAGANKVTVKNCTFNATAGDKAGAIANQNCAAVEIDNFQNNGVGAAHVVVTENNTYSDNFSGEWRIKNFVAGNAITVNGIEYTQIAVDGKLMTIDANKNVTIL